MLYVSVSSSSQQEVFEGGFLQQPPSRVRGRPSHIQLEGFEPGESDDGVLNRYSRITTKDYLHSFDRSPNFYGQYFVEKYVASG